jgi:ABC-type lipoprotein release transport system permease subunit
MIHVILLGLFMMGGAASLCGLLIASNLSTTPSYTPQLLGHTLPSVSAVDIFAAGVVMALVLCLGAWIIAARVSGRRRRVRYDTPGEEFLPGLWRGP